MPSPVNLEWDVLNEAATSESPSLSEIPSKTTSDSSFSLARFSPVVGYTVAATVAALLIADPWIDRAVNPVGLEVPADEDRVQGSLEVLKPIPAPTWEVRTIPGEFLNTPDENATYYEWEIDHGYINYSLSLPKILLKEPLDELFKEKIETTMSILNRTVSTETYGIIRNSSLHLKYSIKEDASTQKLNINVYRSANAPYNYAIVRDIEIGPDQIEKYTQNEKIILQDTIMSYLQSAYNLDLYEDIEPDEIGDVWKDIYGFVIPGVPYRDYLIAHRSLFAMDDYEDLIHVFADYRGGSTSEE